MEIFDSFEVRWFIEPGPLCDAAIGWFESVACEPERVDHYLDSGREDLGVKLRHDAGKPPKLETKYRLGAVRDVALAAGVAGDLERWRKLSVSVAADALGGSGSWLAVEKERQLRKFAWQAGAPLERPASERPDVGCNLELTRLRLDLGAGRATCWTLGFEAFGPPPALLDILLGACRAALAEPGAPALPATASAGYPRWLASRGSERA